MKALGAAVGLALAATASAHRVDEYLQATILSLGKDRVRASMLLMPGVEVFRRVVGQIDTNSDGAISAAEQKTYAAKVLSDLSFSVDGKRLSPKLRSFKFPKVEEMKKGLGTIELKLEVAMPASSGGRSLEFENCHEPGIGAYLVNCLVPDDPGLRITDQNRNYRQSRYELHYVQGPATKARIDRRSPSPAR